MAGARIGLEPFQHERLSDPRTSIRIVLVQPARSVTDPVRCLLKEVRLDDAKSKYKFEALSYVWGAETGTLPILCHEKQLLVTENCLTALQQLRFCGISRERALWIDAICIDQTQNAVSTAERNRQVELMGEIYAKASRVIVWLGPAISPHVEEVFKRLRFLARWSTPGQPEFAWFDPRRYRKGVLNYITDSGDRGFAKWDYGGEVG
jgi:hypothetical protein